MSPDHVDITDRNRMEESFKNVVEGTSAAIGEAFFTELIKHLALALRVRFALVTEWCGESGSRLRSLACWHRELRPDPLEYDIVGTPCEVTLRDGYAYYPSRVQEQFPNDKELELLNANSYLGVALYGQTELPIGHLCVVHDGPLEDFKHAKSIMTIFASRAAAELERMWSEKEISQALTLSRDLASRLAKAEEFERQRIARELHDEFGQMLCALNLDFENIKRHIHQLIKPEESPELFERIAIMSDSINMSVQYVRRLATSLRPMLLDQLGLIPALEWQVRDFQTRTGMTCEFSCPPQIIELSISDETAMTAFRIVQELLTNVQRHAQASHVRITLKKEPGYLVLEIQDDGVGVPDFKTLPSRSFGLLGIRERIAMLDGEFNLHGIPGKGTTATSRIPL